MRVEDVIVVGAGPAGLATALSLAAAGVDVTLIAPAEAARASDRRTTALLGSSINLLKKLGVFPLLEPFVAPLAGIRLVDDCGGIFRAPEITFMAAELGLEAFGANVANEPLVDQLAQTAHENGRIKRVPAPVSHVLCEPDRVLLDLADGRQVAARLVVAADGRNSLIRKAASIETDIRTYPQSALAVSFAHAKMHHSVSTELHRRNGPLTCVPMAGRASSLVWVESPHEAQRLAALDDAAFCDLLDERLQGLLGRIHDPGPRGVFPLSVLTSARMGQNRVALVGEAAHVMPPIGAQGLNLGLRDAAVLAEIVGDACAQGRDPGTAPVLEGYHQARYFDVATRQVAIDLLNRSLLSDFLPPHALRGAGLHLVANSRPLRELVMRAGLGPAGAVPRLMAPPAAGAAISTAGFATVPTIA